MTENARGLIVKDFCCSHMMNHCFDKRIEIIPSFIEGSGGTAGFGFALNGENHFLLCPFCGERVHNAADLTKPYEKITRLREHIKMLGDENWESKKKIKELRNYITGLKNGKEIVTMTDDKQTYSKKEVIESFEYLFDKFDEILNSKGGSDGMQ